MSRNENKNSDIKSKWQMKLLHIVFFLVVAALFTWLRLPSVMDVGRVDDIALAQHYFDAARVGNDVLNNNSVFSVFEQVYIYVLSSVFLFLGNKIELIIYIQAVFQLLTFVISIFIGFTLFKKVFAWMPAFLYAVVPFVYPLSYDVSYLNLWILIASLIVWMLCSLIKCVVKKVAKGKKTTDEVVLTEESSVDIEENTKEDTDKTLLEGPTLSAEMEKPEDFDWEEMQAYMEESKKPVIQKEAEVLVIDRTAPIENVLPMPKKHVSKVLDYAFEPSEDMMHFDVEIENDEYDY